MTPGTVRTAESSEPRPTCQLPHSSECSTTEPRPLRPAEWKSELRTVKVRAASASASAPAGAPASPSQPDELVTRRPASNQTASGTSR